MSSETICERTNLTLAWTANEKAACDKAVDELRPSTLYICVQLLAHQHSAGTSFIAAQHFSVAT